MTPSSKSAHTAFHPHSLFTVHHSKKDCQKTDKPNLIYNNGIKTFSEYPQPAVCYSPAEGAVRLVANQSRGSHHSYLLPAIDVREEWGRMTTAATLTELTNCSCLPITFRLAERGKKNKGELDPTPHHNPPNLSHACTNRITFTLFTYYQVNIPPSSLLSLFDVSVLIMRKEGEGQVQRLSEMKRKKKSESRLSSVVISTLT